MSEGALVKVALPEMRVPGCIIHPSHSLGVLLGLLEGQGLGRGQCPDEQGVGDPEGVSPPALSQAPYPFKT